MRRSSCAAGARDGLWHRRTLRDGGKTWRPFIQQWIDNAPWRRWVCECVCISTIRLTVQHALADARFSKTSIECFSGDWPRWMWVVGKSLNLGTLTAIESMGNAFGASFANVMLDAGICKKIFLFPINHFYYASDRRFWLPSIKNRSHYVRLIKTHTMAYCFFTQPCCIRNKQFCYVKRVYTYQADTQKA